MERQEVRAQIKTLVEDFKANYTSYKSRSEADIEQLVLRLFKILGWTDVNDVFQQVKTHRGEKRGRADFAFKINDRTVFFLEVKKMGVPLDKEADRQVISYALSQRIPFAVSTNFEELKLFCVEAFDKKDQVFRVFRYEDYSIKDDLFLLSKESFASGNTLKEAESEGRLKKRVTIDKPLLEDLMHIRSLVAGDIEKSYPDKYELNERDEIIQRIIDRLIFIRRCEDVGMNPEGQTLEEIKHLSDEKAYPKLKQLFAKYNDVYDSGLFSIGTDNDCDRITIDGSIIHKLVGYLYESKNGQYIYNFDWIDADVLGQVYEQYLGKILAQTKSGKTKLKEGQAHRKEQGIYYTPTYIVNYIIKNTVGAKLKERKINVNDISILDPACGSGSFLIKAFDEMYNYRRGKGGTDQRKFDTQGIYSIKTEILKNNIFGVDLDNKAVEIAKLNLLLKAAENGRRLPKELDAHVKRGNSIIDDEKVVGADAFRWESEFTDIVKQGGFDIIIGNPPYGAELKENEREYISRKYETAKSYKNTALVFIEKSMNLLKDGGYFGMIVPKSLAYSQAWKPCRDFIKKDMILLVDVSKAFEDVLLEQVIFIIQKGSGKKSYIVENIDTGSKFTVDKSFIDKIDSLIVHDSREDFEVFKHLMSSPLQMKSVSKTSRGLPLQKFITKKKTPYKIFRGVNISRYHLGDSTDFLEKIDATNTKVKQLLQPKIISQRIVAHVTRPKDHIIIMSALDGEGQLNVDTVENTTLTDKKYKLETILAIMNSELISWYAYRYIFGKAIRTMDFDDYYVGKIPLPHTSKSVETALTEKVSRINDLNKKVHQLGDKKTAETAKLDEEVKKTNAEIDELVYKIYGVTDAEKKTIKESLN
ncbi:MAG: N-6 DNA methylase [Candidatus Aenigmatarchaeota archaeon]|nr:MAG: N-6 DNA methylase [Candidatus Aenigmarchaeota archaeon]